MKLNRMRDVGRCLTLLGTISVNNCIEPGLMVIMVEPVNPSLTDKEVLLTGYRIGIVKM